MPIIGKSLSKTSKTCSKNPHKHSWIDLFVTNRSKSFQNSMVVETGFSDFHKVSLTSMNALMKKITNVYLILSDA